ncbi:hypothetical protein [Sodalis sp. RH22]|uniref:hypothetical protein n=1 Tax=unclassified Sodalis (in: enterobacteria) TaxID=2636512 RepID=UPI0039B382B4
MLSVNANDKSYCNNITYSEIPEKNRTDVSLYDHKKFTENINFIKEIYRAKYQPTTNITPHAFVNDYLTVCVDASSDSPPCLPARNHEIRPSPDTCQRNLFRFMLNTWFQWYEADVEANIKIKLTQCMRLFLHEYENYHYSGTPLSDHAMLEQTFVLPEELKCILPPGVFVEKIILETMIYLLSQEKTDFFCTPTLLYGHQANRINNHFPLYLREDTQKRFHIARVRMETLAIGHYLMMPLLSMQRGEDGVLSQGDHFSAILVEKKSRGFVFNIFDSYDSGEENEDKEKLLDALIDESSDNEIRYFGQQFQFNNDCSIHTYNFLRLCTLAPSAALSEQHQIRQMTERYILNIKSLQQLLGRDDNATSQMLRTFFVLDGIKSGYTQGMTHDFELLGKIYDVQEGGAVAGNATRPPGFWQRLRRNPSLTLRPWKRCGKNSTSPA